MKITPSQILLILTTVLCLPFEARSIGAAKSVAIQPDSLVSEEVHRLLASDQAGDLNFPKTVKRLYQKRGNRPIWSKPQSGEGQTWQAMLLLDCVAQYGLAARDYHPGELTYIRVHALLDTPDKLSIVEQARFDIVLTDAILTLMNHMHYGKLNPQFTAAILDDGGTPYLGVDAALLSALNKNSGYDFLTAIESMQPGTNLYQNLQRHMRLLAGYTANNNKVRESEIRLMAINLERLRWSSQKEDSDYIQVNIPAYTLQFHQPDTTYTFKVAVGKPGSPTPMLNSKITYLTTAPDVAITAKRFEDEVLPAAIKDAGYLKKNHFAIYDKKGKYIVVKAGTLLRIAQQPGNYTARHASGHDGALGRLVFRFANRYQIDLHDMPKPDFFELEKRGLTTGCVWLTNAEKLGALILKNDRQLNELPALDEGFNKYQRKIFVLKHPLPISLAYLTCEVRRGELITYPDIYQLDGALEHALYPSDQTLAMR
jgi:murein L,D-transpeptidase YcbB/YkuD